MTQEIRFHLFEGSGGFVPEVLLKLLACGLIASAKPRFALTFGRQIVTVIHFPKSIRDQPRPRFFRKGVDYEIQNDRRKIDGRRGQEDVG